MTTKGKAEQVATRPASNTAFTERNSTPQQDRLVSWFALAKNAKARAVKAWKRGNQRGRIDAYLLALLALMFVSAALIVGGLNHA